MGVFCFVIVISWFGYLLFYGCLCCRGFRLCCLDFGCCAEFECFVLCLLCFAEVALGLLLLVVV